MSTKPINLKGHEVKAILNGRKTQLRRILKDQPPKSASLLRIDNDRAFLCDGGHPGHHHCEEYEYDIKLPCQVGDLLWVREHHARDPLQDYISVHYFADGDLTIEGRHDAGLLKRYSASQMPRWASRITLRVTDVRVERLQDISDKDAVCEGLTHHSDPAGDGHQVRELFAYLWMLIHGDDAWDANPWVVAYSFEPIFENVDKVAK